MSLLRIVVGWTCIAIAIVMIVVATLGGFAGIAGVSRFSPALMAHLPGVVFGFALLAVGAWLLKRKKSS